MSHSKKLFYVLVFGLLAAFLIAFYQGCHHNPDNTPIDTNAATKDSVMALKQELAIEKLFSDSLKQNIVVFEQKIEVQKRGIKIVSAKYDEVRQQLIKLYAVGSVELLALNMGVDSLPMHLAGMDTVCDVGMDQVKTLNGVYVDKKECLEINDSLNATIENYGILVGKKDTLIASLDDQVAKQDTVIGMQGRVMVNDSIAMVKADRKIKSLKRQRNGVGVVGLVLLLIALL